MKAYYVTIQAVITKTFYIQANNEDDADTEAHGLFNPHSGEEEEKYEQTTLALKEVF
jgi:hypothetical protein